MEINTDIRLGDCKEVLKGMPENSVDLIFTSPPDADQRKSTYGGIHPTKQVEWFLPISEELLRVLKPTGSFVLNIKERVVSGEKHIRYGANFGNAETRLALDRRIHMA